MLVANDRTNGVLLTIGRRPVLNAVCSQKEAKGSHGLRTLLYVFGRTAKQIVIKETPTRKRHTAHDSN